MIYDSVVIGGGPAGLAASIRVFENNKKVLLIEREARLGGILKQCIHDGFGLQRFKEKLSGPEYAERFISKVYQLGIEYWTHAFVTRIIKKDDLYVIYVVTKDGIKEVETKTIILATGCRERTAKQVNIHGTRPYGVLTAGACQALVNINGIIPAKRCVVLGSGDIGLIMARRLTLEGVKVLGVYEIKDSVSGLTRNVHQCLNDFNIPLTLSTTVTKVFGKNRLEAIEIAKVDNKMQVIPGTQEIIKCDTLILSVGLIPENELVESIGVTLDRFTKGPKCDNNLETMLPGIYTCGNATHVNDLVDYVSESAEIAGDAASNQAAVRELVDISIEGDVAYIVPQMINVESDKSKVNFYFRSRKILTNPKVVIEIDNKEVVARKYQFLKPPEMEKLVVDLSDVKKGSKVLFKIVGGDN